jgi:hypothetical protein
MQAIQFPSFFMQAIQFPSLLAQLDRPDEPGDDEEENRRRSYHFGVVTVVL